MPKPLENLNGNTRMLLSIITLLVIFGGAVSSYTVLGTKVESTNVGLNHVADNVKEHKLAQREEEEKVWLRLESDEEERDAIKDSLIPIKTDIIIMKNNQQTMMESLKRIEEK